MSKFKRVSKQFINDNAGQLTTLPYFKIVSEEGLDRWLETPSIGWYFSMHESFYPYEAVMSELGRDSEGISWMWVKKENPDHVYLLEYAPKHPLEQDEPITSPAPVKDPVPYYTYEPNYIVLNDQSIVFPVIRIVDDSFPECEFKTLAESGMLFTDMKKLGEHFEVYSRTYVYHPWVQSAADFRLNQKSE